MIELLRVYIIEDNKEICIKDPKEIIKLINTTKEGLDIDYDLGQWVTMGNSRDLIGVTVKIGKDIMEIPKH